MNYEKFKGQLGSWGEVLEPFIVSKECDRIYEKLKRDAANGVVICPDSADTFRAFKECPFNDLKIVILGQDPYPWVKEGHKVADGIAFSCKYTGKCQPSLELLYDGIERELYDGLNLTMYKCPDLTYLANQGVLLLNSTLTVRKDMVGSHQTLWKDFVKYVLNIVSISKKGVVFLLLGDQAQSYESCIVGGDHYVYTAEHPARAAWEHRKWNSEHIFYLSNEVLKKLDKPPIHWLYEETPF